MNETIEDQLKKALEENECLQDTIDRLYELINDQANKIIELENEITCLSLQNENK